MTHDQTVRIIDPEEEDRNEKFSSAMMGAASGQIFGLMAFFIGLVNGVMSDQQGGLINIGWGMGLFTFFTLLHFGISRKWVGSPQKPLLQESLGFFGPAFLGALLYFYASFANTDWLILGYAGGLLYVILLGKGVLFIEALPPRSRKTTYIFSPFDKEGLLIVVLIGSVLGVGVGMASHGQRGIGRGPFARTYLSEKIKNSRFQVDLLLFGMPHSYRLIQALKGAQEKGVPVRVLLTRDAASHYSRQLDSIESLHVPIRILPSALPTYVHPMALFDRRILLYGSGGWGALEPGGGNQMKMVANILSIGKIRNSQKTFDSLWGRSHTVSASPP